MIFRLLLAAVCTASAAEPADVMMRADLQAISVPVRQTVRLLPKLREPETNPAAVAELQAMIARGSATLRHTSTIWCAQGDHAIAETREEVRYATNPFPVAPPGGEWKPTWWDRPVVYKVYWSALSSLVDVPTDFATQNCGLTFEVGFMEEKPGQSQLFSTKVEETILESYQRLLPDRPKPADGGTQHLPVFRTISTSSVLTAVTRDWMVLGVFVSPDAQPQATIYLLRTTVFPAPR